MMPRLRLILICTHFYTVIKFTTHVIVQNLLNPVISRAKILHSSFFMNHFKLFKKKTANKNNYQNYVRRLKLVKYLSSFKLECAIKTAVLKNTIFLCLNNNNVPAMGLFLSSTQQIIKFLVKLTKQ